MDAQRLAEIAAALGSETRAEIVCALLSGGAHTGRELARHLSLAPSTVSEHLARLVDAGLVVVEAQGRHRYARLAGEDVARLVEGLLASPPPVPPAPRPRVPHGLGFARSCYDHLAGRLGVALCDALVQRGVVTDHDGTPTLTASGRAWLAGLGVVPSPSRGRPVVRWCLDWSERRHHLAGGLGAALLSGFLERRWLAAPAGARRELRLTRAGRAALRDHFDLPIGQLG